MADAGYDSKENREALRKAGVEPVIAVNPRRRENGRLASYPEEDGV